MFNFRLSPPVRQLSGDLPIFLINSRSTRADRRFKRRSTCARGRVSGGTLPHLETTVNFRFRGTTALAVSFMWGGVSGSIA